MAKVSLKFGCAKQSKNLERYLLTIYFTQLLSVCAYAALFLLSFAISQRGLFHKLGLFLSLYKQSMAFPVVEFSREGYKIRKVFG